MACGCRCPPRCDSVYRPFLFVDVHHPPYRRCQIRIRIRVFVSFWFLLRQGLSFSFVHVLAHFPRASFGRGFLAVTRDVIAVTLLDFSPALRRVAGLSNMLFACLAHSLIMPSSSYTSLAPLSLILGSSSPTTPVAKLFVEIASAKWRTEPWVVIDMSSPAMNSIIVTRSSKSVATLDLCN